MSKDFGYPSLNAIRTHPALINLRCFFKYCLWHGGWLVRDIIVALVVILFKILDGVGELASRNKKSYTEMSLEERAKYNRKKREKRRKRRERYAPIVKPIAVTYRKIKNTWKKFNESKLSTKFYNGLFVFLVVLVIIWLIYVLWYATQRYTWIQFFSLIGVVLVLVALVCVVVVTCDYLSSKKVVSRTKETAKKTAVIKRIYGVCPVSFEEEPKWSRKITGGDKDG